MKLLKSAAAAVLVLGFVWMSADVEARGGLTRVTCHWSNGDVIDLTSDNEEFIDMVIAHCMDTGGTAGWE